MAGIDSLLSATTTTGVLGSLGSVTTTGVVSSDSVTFSKASYAVDVHGGPTPTYPASVTLDATVSFTGTPTLAPDGPGHEARPMTRQLFKIVTAEDPATALGLPLATYDLATWQGISLTVLGRSVPQAGGYLTYAEAFS